MTDTFQIKEEFLGLYNTESTSGLTINAMIFDVLIRLQLPMENLRSQTYDGAANMTGKFHSYQTEIKNHQPLARFINCGAHVTQLVVCKAFNEARVIRDAFDHIHELNKLYTQSGKFKNLYLAQHGGDVETPQPGSLKPIYLTRWLTRLFAVKSVLQNYSYALDALKQAAANFGTNTAARANGIYIGLANSKCVLGLHTALPILEILESLNKSLQSLSVHFDGMMNSVRLVKSELINLRTTKKFADIFKEAQKMNDNLGLEYISFPRKRKAPRTISR